LIKTGQRLAMLAYWIRISPKDDPTPLHLGVGITAHSEEDARALFVAAFGSAVQIQNIEPIENMQRLDQKHVVPNMGNVFTRGIWFPLGYDHRS
jgi:hypothetical protein